MLPNDFVWAPLVSSGIHSPGQARAPSQPARLALARKKEAEARS